MQGAEPVTFDPAPGDELELRIDDLGRGGDGLARLEGGLLGFVPRTLPGERVRARVRERRGRRIEFDLVALTETSPDRVVAPCRHFVRCGGCQLQHLAYGAQLALKRAQLVRKLTRLLGPSAEQLVEAVVPSPEPFGYRNKHHLQRGPDGFGFYDLRGETLVAIDACPLATSACNSVMAVVREWLSEDGAPARGFLLGVLVRSGAAQRHLILVCDDRAAGAASVAIARGLPPRLPEDGIFVTFKRADSRKALGPEIVHVAGPERMLQGLGPFTLDLGPASFAQVNSAVAASLYAHVATELGPRSDEEALDLFCGSGALSLHLARSAGTVLGVELDHRAVGDAQRSAVRNGVLNVAFRAGRCETIAERLWKQGKRYRVATFNPPRTGLPPRLVGWLDKLGLERAVYVSCSPPTLVRDLARLGEAGFRVERVVPFDQFAQTYHLEAAVTLVRAPLHESPQVTDGLRGSRARSGA